MSGRSTGRVSCKSTELKRCSMIEMRWNKYEVSLASPVWTQIRRPISEIKFRVVELKTPRFSTAVGSNLYAEDIVSNISLLSWWLPYRPLYQRLRLLCQRKKQLMGWRLCYYKVSLCIIWILPQKSDLVTIGKISYMPQIMWIKVKNRDRTGTCNDRLGQRACATTRGPKKLHFISYTISLGPFKKKWNRFHQNVPSVSGNKDYSRLQFLCSCKMFFVN